MLYPIVSCVKLSEIHISLLLLFTFALIYFAAKEVFSYMDKCYIGSILSRQNFCILVEFFFDHFRNFRKDTEFQNTSTYFIYLFRSKQL